MCKGLHGCIRDYNGITGAYKGLQGNIRDYSGLQHRRPKLSL